MGRCCPSSSQIYEKNQMDANGIKKSINFVARLLKSQQNENTLLSTVVIPTRNPHVITWSTANFPWKSSTAVPVTSTSSMPSTAGSLSKSWKLPPVCLPQPASSMSVLPVLPSVCTSVSLAWRRTYVRMSEAVSRMYIARFMLSKLADHRRQRSARWGWGWDNLCRFSALFSYHLVCSFHKSFFWSFLYWFAILEIPCLCIYIITPYYTVL